MSEITLRLEILHTLVSNNVRSFEESFRPQYIFFVLSFPLITICDPPRAGAGYIDSEVLLLE